MLKSRGQAPQLRKGKVMKRVGVNTAAFKKVVRAGLLFVLLVALAACGNVAPTPDAELQGEIITDVVSASEAAALGVSALLHLPINP